MTSAVEKRVVICNERGLHARAAARLVKLVEQFPSAQLRVIKDDMDVCGISIMGLLMLGAGKGTEIILRADGPDASAAIDHVASLIERRFDEDQ